MGTRERGRYPDPVPCSNTSDASLRFPYSVTSRLSYQNMMDEAKRHPFTEDVE
jgi:hypothetical protein